VPGVVAFSPETVDEIMRSTELRSRHVTVIRDTVEQGNFAGIALDYTTVNPTLREQFTAFVEELANALHQNGRTLTLSLPLPSLQDGTTDTGAYDWERIGAAADTIELKTELDQDLYFQTTEAALEYVTSRVDRSKLLIGVSALSVERGSDGLRTMPLLDALSIASTIAIGAQGEITAGAAVPLTGQNVATAEGASGIHWDDNARSVTFSFAGRGGKRTVWLANAFSTAFRLELAQRFDLGGVVINDVSAEGGAADVWAPVQELIDNGSVRLSRPNGDLFVPVWSASAGTVSPTSGDATTWTTPAEPGTYDLTLVVSDGVARAGQRVPVDVAPAPAAPPE
jgi:spore germination protein YaaH